MTSQIDNLSKTKNENSFKSNEESMKNVGILKYIILNLGYSRYNKQAKFHRI